MTGVSSLIAAWFSLVLILETIVVVTQYVEPLLTTMVEKKKGGQSQFEIVVLTVDNRTVFVEITNLGPYDKSVSALRASDMFVTYVGSNRRIVNEWLGYGPRDSGPAWMITSVKTYDYPGELRDPIKLPEGDEGLWNVGETLVAKLMLSDTPNSTYPIMVKLVVA